MLTAAASLLFGAFQLIRPRRDLLHKRMGYAYVAAMLVTNVTALTVYEFNGRFNVFHALALVSLVTLAMAMRPMLMRPRPKHWRITHYYWVAWSYAGLSAAASTEFLLRVMLLPGWMASAIGTPLILLPAAFLIERYSPRRLAARAAAQSTPV
jgi:uncharacterized membrane protein